jgi:hypothetical protein
MTGFGASAPASELYEQFGITADAVAATATGDGARQGATTSGDSVIPRGNRSLEIGDGEDHLEAIARPCC